MVAGDGNVGKTSLVRQYCEGKFLSSRMMTIGVDFQTKLVTLEERTVKLSIWDMAGQERFRVVRDSFYRGSLAAALIFDLSVPQTLVNLVGWYHEILKVVPDQHFVVVGNKVDLTPDVDDRWGKEFARILRASYVRTSALTGEGVPRLFEYLARAALRDPKGSPNL